MPGPHSARSSARRGSLAAAVLATALVHALTVTGSQAGPPEGEPTAELVRFPFPQEDGSLTPYSFELGHPLVNLIYDTLLWRNADGVPQPWLASAIETSSDGRRLTITLADGARWHDGQPLTASDVAFTFDYVAARPHPRFTGELEPLERATAVDERTVVLELRHAAPGFVDQPLSDLPILPRHLWADLGGDELPGGLPVGSGPYRLVEHLPGATYRFEANDDYFRGPPAVAALEVPIMGDAEETLRALERRQVDMIPLGLTDDLAASLESFGVSFARGPSFQGTVLMLNLRRPPFDDPAVRRAVSQALDLGRIARNVAAATPANRGYLHPESRFASSETLHTPDVEAARTVLAGLPSPVEVLAPEADPLRAEAARQVVLALQRAGASAELKLLSRADLGQAVGEDGATPTFEAAIWGAPPLASYDPVLLGRLFGSDPRRAPFNYSGYASLEFDELARRIERTPDPQERQDAIDAALRLLATDAPVVPLLFPEASFAYRPAIYDGWGFVKGSGILDKRSFVEPASAGPDDSAVTPVSPESEELPLGWIAAALGGVTVALAAGGAIVTLRRREPA